LSAFILFPFWAFSQQISLDKLGSTNGLAYEPGSTTPYTGKAYALFPSGDTQTVIHYKEGRPDGDVASWYRKNARQVEGHLKEGKKSGTWYLWYPTGQMKKKSGYADDLQDGEEIFWYEDGKMEKKGTYQNAKLTGKYEWFYPSGQKSQEGYFVNGKEDSTWNNYFENGKPQMTGQMRNFVRDGEWTWWDVNGVPTKKLYQNGLVMTDKDNFDTYIEKMEYYISKKNFKEALKNCEAADQTITDKTENNPAYMGLAVYHSRCYSTFSHYTQAEEVLLKAIGLSDKQTRVVLDTYRDSTTEQSRPKVEALIAEIITQDNASFRLGNHIALALCYNILDDSTDMKVEQQVSMMKGQLKDWIINTSLELYKISAGRANNYRLLNEINARIKKEGATPELELDKARYLVLNENYAEAEKIVDKALKADAKNLTALLLKTDLQAALGNMDKMAEYQKKALAVDPNAYGE